MIYFTSDNHFCHNNIIRYCHRPFSDIESMNSHMIESWNKTVTPEDEVYYLGDFSFKATKRSVRYIMNRLNGKKYFIKGNHDRSEYLNNLLNAKLIEWWKYNHDFTYEHEGKTYDFSLSHYPHYPTKEMGSESTQICLFGHVHGIFEHHGTYVHKNGGIDVGVDNVGYEPISIVKIINLIENQKKSMHNGIY